MCFFFLALNDLFMLVMTCMIIVNTINMGAQLDVEMLKRVLKKPIGNFFYKLYFIIVLR